MLKLLGKISLVVLLALILSIGTDYFYRRAYGLNYEWPKNLVSLPEIVDKYELVALGNSHTESGLNLDEYKVKSLFLASVAQSFEYDFAMLKMHSRQIKKDAIIIINVSPLSFSQKKPDKEDYVNMNYYDGRLSPFLIPHIKISEYLQIQIVPFVRAGYLWREKHAKNLEEKAMRAYVAEWDKQSPKIVQIPKEVPQTKVEKSEISSAVPLRSSVQTFTVEDIRTELNKPADPPDGRLIESMYLLVDKWYNSGGFDVQYFDTNTRDLENLIAYCLEHNWRPVLITIPISDVLVDGLEPGYMKQYLYDNLEKIDLNEIKYFNFASNPKLTRNKNLFRNSDHLNDKGATITSYLLLQRLIQTGYLSEEADGYDYTAR